MNFNVDPIFSIFSLLRCASGLSRERAKFYGLNDLETIILIHIGLLENPTQKNLAENLSAPKQTINNVIKAMEDDGLINLIQSKDDKRIRILRLTEKGKKNRDEKLSPIIEANKRMYEKLGEEKVKEIGDALRLFTSLIKEDFKKEDEWKV